MTGTTVVIFFIFIILKTNSALMFGFNTFLTSSGVKKQCISMMEINIPDPA